MFQISKYSTFSCFLKANGRSHILLSSFSTITSSTYILGLQRRKKVFNFSITAANRKTPTFVHEDTTAGCKFSCRLKRGTVLKLREFTLSIAKKSKYALHYCLSAERSHLASQSKLVCCYSNRSLPILSREVKRSFCFLRNVFLFLLKTPLKKINEVPLL